MAKDPVIHRIRAHALSRLFATIKYTPRVIVDTTKPVVCVVGSSNGRTTETFIRSHYERLPASVIGVYGKGLFRTLDERIVGSIKTFLRRHRVEVVLAEYGFTGVRVMKACKELKTPLVVHFHGFDAYSTKILDAFGEQYKELFVVASAILVPSSAMRDQLVQLGCEIEKISVNPYGVDTQAFHESPPTRPADAPYRFLAVGRFVEKKAPYLTLLAFAKVFTAGIRIQLRMIGGGPLLEVCQRIAESLDLADHVKFLGEQSHEQVKSEMSNADCFVQHSVRAKSGDCEGLPNTVLEALSAGLPVVSTRHAGIPEAIEHGTNGFLVEEGDVSRMASYMAELAADPGIGRQMGKKNREKAVRYYSIEKSIAGLWAALEQARFSR